MKRIAFLLFLAACGKSDEKPAEAPAPATDTSKAAPTDTTKAAGDPACAAKVKELEPFLAQLAAEEASHEIDFGSTMVKIDRPAAPVEQRIDNVTITVKAIQPFDASESNHADTKLEPGADQPAVLERMKTIKGMPDGVGARIRFDVDEAAAWSDVVRTVDAAMAAGYTEALFAFTATSKLTAPPGVDDRTTSIEVFDAAGARLEELGKTCPGLDKYNNNAADIARALIRCNCVASPDEVRALRWKLSRWGQAVPRVGVVVTLGGAGATAVAQPKASPWAEAHARLLEAAATGAVTLTAK